MLQINYKCVVTLFKEPVNKRMWVVGYGGSSHYFDTFEAAIGYILQRHDSDPDTFAVARLED